MESINPGGTGKDRAAQYMLEHFRNNGDLNGRNIVVEGTSGRYDNINFFSNKT